MMYLAGILAIAYCAAMLYAANIESTEVLLASNLLIIPSFLIMVWITVMNWRKSSAVYPTFEEIAKVDLDNYFVKENQRS